MDRYIRDVSSDILVIPSCLICVSGNRSHTWTWAWKMGIDLLIMVAKVSTVSFCFISTDTEGIYRVPRVSL